MKKTYLEKFISKNFQGNWVAAANEMVVLFCTKYHIAGSGDGHDFYELVQDAWKEAIRQEKEATEIWKE